MTKYHPDHTIPYTYADGAVCDRSATDTRRAVVVMLTTMSVTLTAAVGAVAAMVLS